MRRTSGFTLIELLVVIATISILAAIIMPVFAHVKASARRTTCASNMRQFIDAFTMYANDWQGVWPSPGGLVGERNYWDPGLDAYIPDARSKTSRQSIWVCPQYTQEWKMPYEIRSYSMNMYLRTPCDIDPWQRGNTILNGIALTDIDFLADTILLCEGAAAPGTGYVNRPGNWKTVAGYPGTDQPRHLGGNNYLFCDGHIKWMKWENTIRPENLWYVRQGKRTKDYEE